MKAPAWLSPAAARNGCAARVSIWGAALAASHWTPQMKRALAPCSRIWATVDHVFFTAATLLFSPKLAGDSSAMKEAIDTRFWGSYYVAKYAAPKMAEDGSITFTTGTAARKPIPGGAVVSASCGAVEALARALALELAPIRVNTVAPGLTDTPLHERMAGSKERAAKRIADGAARLPLKRAGRPEDIAEAVLFLMKNRFITGITLTIDGGHMLI